MIDFHAFGDELEKLAAEKPRVRRPDETDRMTRMKWRQTALDVPAVILASGLGYGVGRTLSEELGIRAYRHAAETGTLPGWVRHLPAATSIASSLGAYSLGRMRGDMQARREKAEREKKLVR